MGNGSVVTTPWRQHTPSPLTATTSINNSRSIKVRQIQSFRTQPGREAQQPNATQCIESKKDQIDLRMPRRPSVLVCPRGERYRVAVVASRRRFSGRQQRWRLIAQGHWLRPFCVPAGAPSPDNPSCNRNEKWVPPTTGGIPGFCIDSHNVGRKGADSLNFIITVPRYGAIFFHFYAGCVVISSDALFNGLGNKRF